MWYNLKIMRTVHFDIDKNIDAWISGEKYSFSVQQIKKIPKPKEIEAITIKSQSKITQEILKNLPSLKLIITRTVGTDHVNLEGCKKKGIAVYHILDYGAFNIAEHVFALLLCGTRRILESQNEIQKGKFSYINFLGFSLRGKVLGVIGTGKIGLEVIKLANAFGMTTIAYDVIQNATASKELNFEYTSLDKLLTQSDVISLHAPLLPDTKYIINKETIGKMKNGVVLINAARGELIKTSDLIKKINKFRFVGLDVLEKETAFSKDHPLLKFKNVLITPHIAFYTDLSLKRIAEETEKCLQNFLKGDPSGRV